MILERRLVLFVVVLCFPCSLCDDNASQEATNSIPHKNWNSGTIEKLKSNVNYDFPSTKSSASFANDSAFAGGLGISVSYDPESTESYGSHASDNPGFAENPTSSIKVDSASTENTIVNNFGLVSASYNDKPTENPTNYASDDFSSTRHSTSAEGSTENLATSASYKSTDSRENSVTFNLANYASDDPRRSITGHSTSPAITGPRSTKSPTSFASDSGFTSDLGSSASYNDKPTENPTNHASDDFSSTRYSTSAEGSTENLATSASYKSTISEELTTRYDSDPTDNDTNESSSIADITQSYLNTVSDIGSTNNTVDTTTIDPTICGLIWLVNDEKNLTNLKVDNKSTEWIALSWEFQYDNVTYSIERCEGDNCTEINETETWHNATDLEPCTEYKFTVTILAEFCEINGGSLTETTDDTISEIGDVLELSSRNISVTTVQLTWQAPVLYAKCISNYSIAQCDENSCNNTVVNYTNYTANDLNPCTEYNFTVKAVTSTVESAGSHEIVKTASPKLSKPESVRVIPGNFSLNVTWEPPTSDASCIKHYLVSVGPNKSLACNTTNTNCSIQDLHACATYEVHVEAVNEDDVPGETAIKSNMTNRYKTNPPKPLLPIPPPHANNITIIWNIEKENNDCQLSAIFTVCNHTERRGSGYDPLDNLSSTNVAEENVNKSIFTMNTTVSDLSPYTTYTCWGYIVSIGEMYSDWSEEVTATTFEAQPCPPTFEIEEISNTNFSLTWNLPTYLPGVLEQCDIVISWEPRNEIPEWCVYDERKIVPINCNINTFTYDFEVKPFATYKVKMRAKTKAVEWSIYNERNFSTKSGVPGAVTKFNSTSIIIKESTRNPNVLETLLTWGMPCSLNGEFEFFKISINGIKDGSLPHSFFRTYKCPNYVSMNHNNMCTMILSDEEDEFNHRLKGEFNYTFAISTKVRNVDSLGQETSQSMQYPPGIPPQPEKGYIDKITLGSATRLTKTTTSAVIFLPLFLNDNGNIKYYAVMVSEKGHNERSSARFDLNKNWPNASTWKEAMMKEFAITYQATRRKWDPYEEHVDDLDGIEVIKYEVGVDTHCKDSSSNTDQRLYCNGPLKPDVWYDVRIRAFTYGGYTDSDVFLIKTNAELNIIFVIGAVFSILFMGILVTMMLLVRKCSPYILLRRLLHSDMPGSPVPAPFTRKKFINHCQELVDNPGKLSNEFRLLQTLSVDLQMPTNTACLQANRKKNRYSDILPYDFSRVKLEVIDNDPNTDYINASFIRGYSGEDEYIACQGPKEETTYDFWRMVDQYNINIIVMLTQLVEKGKEKCHQYYPAIRETFRYESMTIRCTSELDFRTYTQRTLVLQKENKKRSITHLHFKDWPDHDVPEDFDAMINFCQIMRRNINANKDFIVVHCSAGIGRTGTLIAIDILLQHLRDDRKLDVFGTVYRLRHNRINMVQRESQYAYIYNCIKQVLKNPYFLKTCKPPPVSPVYQNISKKAKEATNSDNNLVNNLELLKKCNSSISMESLDSIYNLFPWSTARNTINSGLRHYKSMGAINVKTHHVAIERSRTLDRVFYKSHNQKDSSCEISTGSSQENFPLLTCSKSAEVVGDSIQYATDKTCERDD